MTSAVLIFMAVVGGFFTMAAGALSERHSDRETYWILFALGCSAVTIFAAFGAGYLL